MVFLNFLPVQKLIFGHVWNCKECNLVIKFIRESDLFDFTSFLDWTFLNFLAHCAILVLGRIQFVGSKFWRVWMGLKLNFRLMFGFSGFGPRFGQFLAKQVQSLDFFEVFKRVRSSVLVDEPEFVGVRSNTNPYIVG